MLPVARATPPLSEPPGLSLAGVDPICQTGIQIIAFWSKIAGHLYPQMADNQLKARQVYKNIAYNGVFGDTCFGNVIKTEIPGRAGDDAAAGRPASGEGSAAAGPAPPGPVPAVRGARMDAETEARSPARRRARRDEGKGIPGRAGDDEESRGSGWWSKMREKSFRQGA